MFEQSVFLTLKLVKIFINGLQGNKTHTPQIQRNSHRTRSHNYGVGVGAVHSLESKSLSWLECGGLVK